MSECSHGYGIVLVVDEFPIWLSLVGDLQNGSEYIKANCTNLGHDNSNPNDISVRILFEVLVSLIWRMLTEYVGNELPPNFYLALERATHQLDWRASIEWWSIDRPEQPRPFRFGRG
jgi:hypothetical protein